ncbi:WSSV365 [White spot syndrome virus]|uniref:WSSV365 n=1 Tax=White spot syndrome virus TaxID=342409 RepID=A0A2I6SC63_9VIRU|nr:WSSV365 [White spot syndrome virus]
MKSFFIQLWKLFIPNGVKNEAIRLQLFSSNLDIPHPETRMG